MAEVWLDDYKKYYYERIGNDLVSNILIFNFKLLILNFKLLIFNFKLLILIFFFNF